MSPKPFTENDAHKYSPNCDCACCARVRFRQRNPHLYGCDATPVQAWMSWRPIIAGVLIMLCVTLVILATLWLAFSASARAAQPKPVAAPQSLLKARNACGNHASRVKCRTALRHAYDAIAWQRHERLHQGAYGVDHAIRLASALYSVPLSEMRSVGACESHLTATSKNRSSTASGLFQFLDSTWNRAGIPGFSVFDPYANALAAARLVTRDHGWHEWSCHP